MTPIGPLVTRASEHGASRRVRALFARSTLTHARLVRGLGWLVLICASAASACGDDDSDAGGSAGAGAGRSGSAAIGGGGGALASAGRAGGAAGAGQAGAAADGGGRGGAAAGSGGKAGAAGADGDAGPGDCAAMCMAGQHCELVMITCIRAPCPQPRPMCVDDPAPGSDTCGSRGSHACPSAQYCDYLRGRCGADDSGGTCTDVPQICNDIAMPVCGCDGKTYGNACNAASKRVSIKSDGACP